MESRTDLTCPLPWPAQALPEVTVTVPVGSGCLALMDPDRVAAVWEDLLFDGHEHDHAPGGLMLHRGAIGTHLLWATSVPVAMLHTDGDLIGLSIDLDTIEDELLSDELFAGGDDHAHVDGWSEPHTVAWVSDLALLGDPAGLPEADATGGLMTLRWPAAAGHISGTVLTTHGIRREWRILWHRRPVM